MLVFDFGLITCSLFVVIIVFDLQCCFRGVVGLDCCWLSWGCLC